MRRALPSGLVAVSAALALALGAAPAAAQPPPPPPDTAQEAQAELDRVQREAEALTEEWHAATDAAKARADEVEALRAAVEPARAATEAARQEEEVYREQVDALVASVFESGQLDQLNAWLSSTSPQDLLDEMSALEMVWVDHRDALSRLAVLVEATTRAQADADAAVVRAETAAAESVRAEEEVLVRKKDADKRIQEAEALLERLTPEQRRARDTDDGAPTTPVSGTGVGVEALEAAKTRIGSTYVWGATGPNSFDCSGLTSWAFKQAGVTLPRSSRQQAAVGSPVAWNDIRPGDLIFYYSPVSHVGIAAGDGKMVDAPQTGQSVGYRTISKSAFVSARRL